MDTQAPKRQARGRKILQNPLCADPPFTTENLRSILQGALSARWAIPNEQAIEAFCRILNFWHSQFYRAQQDRRLNELVDEADMALCRLRDLVPKIGEELLRRHNDVGGQDQFLLWALKSAIRYNDFISEDHGKPSFLYRQGRADRDDDWPTPAKDWRWLIDVLPVDIETMLRSSNPAYVETRAVQAAILAAVIPRITGDQVTVTSVLDQLAAHAKRK
jgi:hypothetical protein